MTQLRHPEAKSCISPAGRYRAVRWRIARRAV